MHWHWCVHVLSGGVYFHRLFLIIIDSSADFFTQVCWWTAALAHVSWQTQPDLHRAQWALLQCDRYLSPWGVQVSHSAHGGVWHCFGQTGRGGDTQQWDLFCLPTLWGRSLTRGQEVLRHWLGRWDRCVFIFMLISSFYMQFTLLSSSWLIKSDLLTLA